MGGRDKECYTKSMRKLSHKMATVARISFCVSCLAGVAFFFFILGKTTPEQTANEKRIQALQEQNKKLEGNVADLQTSISDIWKYITKLQTEAFASYPPDTATGPGPLPRADAWSSPNKDYIVMLGKIDDDGEVRSLVVKKSSGETKVVGILPKQYSYVQLISEGEGGVEANIYWNNTDNFVAEVYLATSPLEIFQRRNPIMDLSIPVYF